MATTHALLGPRNPPLNKDGTPWNTTGVFPGRRKITSYPEPLRDHENIKRQYIGILTDFKKKMQTELHSRYLIQVEVPVNSLLLKQNTAQ